MFAASLAGSVVPRAGFLAAVGLPAFVLAPSAFARRLAAGATRQRELLGIAGLVAAVAGWSLVWFVVEGTPRPARPLGHHNLLATFLVLLLPLALVPVRRPGLGRWLSVGAALLGVGTVAASRSLSGGLALLLELAVFAALGLRGRTRRRALVGLATLGVVALGVFGGRVGEILRGGDLSAQVRAVYLEAGLRGLAAAPLLGHGPGSTPWTIAAFTRPVPGVTPPGEALGEVHSWPLAVAYELGWIGLAGVLLIAGVFGVRRIRELGDAPDGWLLVAGLAGLAGGLVAGLGTAEWRVTALPLAAAVAVAAALAGGRPHPLGPPLPTALEPPPARGGKTNRVLHIACLAVALFLLAPKIRAQFAYERFLKSGDVAALEAAVGLDPGFPLYRARLAWLRADADMALAAARSGGAVPALWAAAADLGVAGAEPWGRSAALVACTLDPLLPVGPWLALVADPAAPGAAQLGAHALAADPRFGAATWWREHPTTLAAAVRELEGDPGLDLGWRQVALEAFAVVPPEGDATARLGLGFDDDPARAVSLVSFRRRPGPVLLAPVRVMAAEAERLAARLPSAARLASSSTQVLVSPCSPGGPPQELWKTLRKSP